MLYLMTVVSEADNYISWSCFINSFIYNMLSCYFYQMPKTRNQTNKCCWAKNEEFASNINGFPFFSHSCQLSIMKCGL